MQNHSKTRNDHIAYSRSVNNRKAVIITSMEKAQLNSVLNDPYVFVKQILKHRLVQAFVMEFSRYRRNSA